MAIETIQNPSLIYAPKDLGRTTTPPVAEAPAAAEAFGEMLATGIERANAEHVAADQQVEEMVATQGANLHEAMVALSRAEIALRVTMKVGQKLVGAYQEISRMQL